MKQRKIMEESNKKFLDVDDSVTDNSLLKEVNSINTIDTPLVKVQNRNFVVNVFNPETKNFERQCFIKSSKTKKK